MYIVFDTETTGKALNFSAPITNFNNWPRMVQIAWKVFDSDGVETDSQDFIIKPNGFIIPNDVIAIHKITNERAKEEGVLIREVLVKFGEAIRNNKYLIAHNITFDENVVGCELLREGMHNYISDINHIDTMRLTTDYVGIPNKRRSGFKFPSQMELYKKLFNRGFNDAHNALADVTALSECFFKLQDIGILGFKELSNTINVQESIFNITEEIAKDRVLTNGNIPIVPLGLHTFHSILEGAGSIDEYIELAKENQHPAIGITDTSTLSGAFELFKKCKVKNIKPIVGIELLLNDNIGKFEEDDRNLEGDNYKIKVFIKNEQGYRNLNHLIYKSNTEGYFQKQGRITTDWLLKYKEGLIVSTSGLESRLANMVFKGRLVDAEAYINMLRSEFGKDLIVEIQFSKFTIQKQFNNFLIRMIRKYNLMPVISNNVYYPKEEDSLLQDVVTSIKQHRPMQHCFLKEDRESWYFNSEDYKRINKKYGFNYPDKFLEICMNNTIKVVDKCNFELELGVEKFPKYEPTQDVIDYFKTDNTKEIIVKLAFAKLKQKINKYKENGIVEMTDEKIKEYVDRLNYEISVIDSKKMLDYFLVNWEIINYYRKQGNEEYKNFDIGPARGCFKIGSRVKMSDGKFVKIETIKQGDEVVDAFGNSQKVVNKFEYDIKEEIIELKFYDGRIIKCTLDHKILTENNIWVQAKKITKKHKIVCVRDKSVYAKLKDSNIKKYNGKVFDLEVENSHSYNIEGLGVHNSAAGSILSWCLDITKIDSIRFGLYFERFLNPERNSFPDIDIDFMTGTDDVTDKFLQDKYGRERVLSVGTFSTFSEKNTIKDVVRAYKGKEATGFGSDVFAVTNEMPDFLTYNDTLKHWFDTWPNKEECSQRVRSWIRNPENKEIIEVSLRLINNIRGIGQHPAGIVITPTASWNYVPTNIISSNGSMVTAFQEADKSGKDLSEMGILKLDRLKLSTLNVIKEAVELIKKTKGEDISNKINFIDIEDKNLFRELRLGLNHGIFQFESHGMNNLIRGIRVNNFDELVAANALYRPGPMGIKAHEEFITNKFNPEKISYIHPALAPILNKTNGVLVFQEQLMFIADKIGGMGLGKGDMLRRYMDKASKIIAKNSAGEKLTKHEENNKNWKGFQKYWNIFLDGAASQGYDKENVDKIKDWVIQYLGYSFNKCLTKNHKIITEFRGEVDILDVKIGERILGYNPFSGVDELNFVKDIHHNGEKKVYRIKTNSGNVLECTEDHKIMTECGMKTLKNIVENKLKIKKKEYNFIKQFEEVVNIEYIGEIETYDLEIDSEYHNFYANGICVSNSHSLSYSYLAMQTLYLKHYYPTEFYASLLNHPKPGKKEKQQQWIGSAISSAMSKGIVIKRPSRKSGLKWTMTGDKEISMGFYGINGLGPIAYEEMMRLISEIPVNDGEPKKTLETVSMSVFMRLPFSKYNKTAFNACLKAGVFDDWSESRKQLLNLKIKKKKKINVNQTVMFDMNDPEFDIPIKKQENKYPPTSEEEKRVDFIDACNFDLEKIKYILDIKKDINNRSKRERPIETIINFDGNDFYMFVVEKFSLVTGRTGKQYLTMRVGDGISFTTLRAFEPIVQELHPKLMANGIYVAEFEKNKKGYINFKRGTRIIRIDKQKKNDTTT